MIFYNCNPVYDHPLGGQIAAGLEKSSFSVSTTDRNDETNALVKSTRRVKNKTDIVFHTPFLLKVHYAFKALVTIS